MGSRVSFLQFTHARSLIRHLQPSHALLELGRTRPDPLLSTRLLGALLGAFLAAAAAFFSSFVSFFSKSGFTSTATALADGSGACGASRRGRVAGGASPGANDSGTSAAASL